MKVLPGVAWTSPPLFNLGIDRIAVEEKYGPAVLRDQDSNGVGDFDAWPVAFECGLEVVLWWFTERDARSHALEVHANQRERNTSSSTLESQQRMSRCGCRTRRSSA
jgi:hypothetical protein